MLNYNMWEGATVSSAQIFLLLVRHLQGKNTAQQCWTVIGRALRFAQTLSLYLRDAT
ncbi:hypothetical protein B0O99DRAFT_632969 [Bisporella sp. PMI_857]|nr:hypothetical protein B0O99DRAFT_632969 [Bisporella sp. PMI_857]